MLPNETSTYIYFITPTTYASINNYYCYFKNVYIRFNSGFILNRRNTIQRNAAKTSRKKKINDFAVIKVN